MKKQFIDTFNGLPIVAGRAVKTESGNNIDNSLSTLSTTKQDSLGINSSTGDSSKLLNQKGQWVVGQTGQTGQTGSTGPTGQTGPKGLCGPVGNRGNTGTSGVVGPTGSCGPKGFCGPRGATGGNGLTGFCGPLGARGNTGSCGPLGYCGPMGNRGTDSNVRGNTGARGNVGPTGANSTNRGMCGPRGNVGPSGADSTNRGICGPRGNVGPTGARGLCGPLGFCGPLGARGNTGGRGFCGPIGNTGDRGNTGGRGFCGPRGYQGNQNTVRYGIRNFNQTAANDGWTLRDTTSGGNAINTISGSCIIWLTAVLVNKSSSTVVITGSLCVNNNAVIYDSQVFYIRPNQSTCVTWGVFYTNSSEVNIGCRLVGSSTLNIDGYMAGSVYKYN